MPASLYRLVGKQHHAEPAVREPEPAPISVQPEEISVPQAEETSTLDSFASLIETQDVPQSLDEGATISSQESLENENSPLEEVPSWDASWTKAQLLTVAKEMGLNVSTFNTKNEILAALSNTK